MSKASAWFLPAVATVLFTMNGPLYGANNCDPSELKESTLAISDLNTLLAYSQDISSHTSDSSSGSLALDVPGYGKLNAGKQQQYLSDLSKSTRLNFSQSDRRFLLVSAMGPEARAMYKDCLENSYRNIYLIPSEGAGNSNRFTVEVSLRNFPTASAIPIQMDIVTKEGTFATAPAGWKIDNSKTRVTGTLGAGAGAAIAVERNIKLPFEMNVTAGPPNFTQPEKLTLPAAPTIEFREEIRYSNLFSARCSDCEKPGTDGSPLVIDLPDTETIIPGSEDLRVHTTGSPPDQSWNSFNPAGGNPYQKLKTDEYSTKYRPHNVSYPISVSGARHFTYCADVYFAVKVWVPRPIGSPPQQPQPPTPKPPWVPCK